MARKENGRVFVTGDTHGYFARIEHFCLDNNVTENDTVIILGDAGINYWGDSSDVDLKRRLAKLPISFFCIHGNHEMRPQTISGYTYEFRFGGMCLVEPEFPSIMFAVDGNVYTFAGRQCIAIGGAYSVDKYYRLQCGARWFADEQPDEATKRLVEKKLALVGNRVDVVLSHTCPGQYIPTEVFIPGIDQSTVDTSTEEWLDAIEGNISYDRWLCGHYHTDKTIDKMRFMYHDILPLEEA